jgi:hypothetical protein
MDRHVPAAAREPECNFSSKTPRGTRHQRDWARGSSRAIRGGIWLWGIQSGVGAKLKLERTHRQKIKGLQSEE